MHSSWKQFKNVPIYNDVRDLTPRKINYKQVDIVTGGFPCQDISMAGKGAGIEGERSGLWSEMYRIISEIRPKYALIENVPMLIHRGLERVLCDLAKIGYDAEWQVIGADDVGAWHRRKRIWIVAYPRCSSREKGTEKQRGLQRQPGKRNTRNKSFRSNKTQLRTKVSSNSSRIRWNSGGDNWKKRYFQTLKKWINKKNKSKRDRWKYRPWKTRSIISNSNGKRLERHGKYKKLGLSKELPNIATERSSEEIAKYWSTEPNVGRVANGISNRVDRLKGLGNAIVPQVAENIMYRIKNAV